MAGSRSARRLTLQIVPVEEARASHSTAVAGDFDALVSDAQETLRDVQEDLLESQEEMKEKMADYTETVRLARTHSPDAVLTGLPFVQTTIFSSGTNSYFSDCSANLVSLKQEMDLHLHQNMAVDLPTGATPVKRAWPDAQDQEDPLDHEDRAIALQHLRRQPAPSTMNEEEGPESEDRVDDMRAPRLSTTLAARKAARRSSTFNGKP